MNKETTKGCWESDMKKILIYIFAISLLVLTSCEQTTKQTMKYSTFSTIKVIDKGHNDKLKQYWIKAYDPNNQTIDNAFKIIVDDENLWNLIEVNRQYVADYNKEEHNPWKLQQIEILKK